MNRNIKLKLSVNYLAEKNSLKEFLSILCNILMDNKLILQVACNLERNKGVLQEACT